jgi:hypothetical protein
MEATLFRNVFHHGFTLKILKGEVYWQYLLRRISWHTEREVTADRKNFTEYRFADNSLTRPGGKQATVTEDFDFHISYL